MKILVYITLLCLFTIHSGIGQTKLTILDKKHNTAIFNARIKVKNDTILFQAYSNADGVVNIPEAIQLKASKILVTHPDYDFYSTEYSDEPALDIYLTGNVQSYDDVVITAQLSERKVEDAVYKIQIIDREKMNQMGAVNLKDVLTNSVGVRLSQDNILGSGMSLQGLSGENVKILIDGVPVVGRLNGNIDLSQINLQNIDHIEIIEGPLSVNYGTNALAGVINLISKKNPINSLSAEVQSYYESIGHYNSSAKLSYYKDKNNLGISFGRNFFDGWREDHSTFKNPSPIADSNRYMTWKPKEQIFFGGQYGWKNLKTLVNYKFDWFEETVLNRGYPRAPYQVKAFDDEYFTRRIDNSIQIKKKIKDYGRINFLASANIYQRIKNTYLKDLTTLKQVITENSDDHDTSVFKQFISRMSYVRTKDSVKLNYQIGYDINWETAEGRRIEDKTQHQGDFALFGIVEYSPIKSLAIRPAMRYAYNTNYNSPVLPSLNIKWDLARNLSLRTSYAKGFRAPSIKEMYFEFVDINHNITGNKNLKAESSHNVLANISYRFSRKKLQINPTAGVFYNDITNQISLASVSDLVFSYTNIGRLKTQGVTAGLNMSYKNIQSAFGYSYTGRTSNIISSNFENQFLYYTEVQSSLAYLIKPLKLHLSLFYKFQGAVPNLYYNSNNEIEEGRIGSYSLMDVTISRKFWKQRINLTVGTKNIFNVSTINVIGSGNGEAHSASLSSMNVGTGRTYFMSLQFQFRKQFTRK